MSAPAHPAAYAAVGAAALAAIAVALALPGTAPSAAAEHGQRLAAQYQCGACHVIAGVPQAAGRHGPSLDRFGARSYIAGRVPLSRNALVQWIVDPASLVPGTPMPRLGVPPADAERLAVFLLAPR